MTVGECLAHEGHHGTATREWKQGLHTTSKQAHGHVVSWIARQDLGRRRSTRPQDGQGSVVVGVLNRPPGCLVAEGKLCPSQGRAALLRDVPLTPIGTAD